MITPTLPKIETLTARAGMRLVVGQRYTHRDFQNETASYRLSSFIESLRNRHHWPIETREENAPTNDPTGRRATYGRYFIEPEKLALLREQVGEVRLKAFSSPSSFGAVAHPGCSWD